MKINCKFLIKLFLTILTCYVIYNKIDLPLIKKILEKANKLYLLFALLMLVIAQIISAFRMRFYYLIAEVNITHSDAIRLFFRSMYYSIISPGGIGGDGYKIYIIEKLYKLPKLESLKILLSNRLSGLMVLIIFLISIIRINNDIYKIINLNKLLILTLPFFVLGYILIAKSIFNESYKVIIISLTYSFFIQIFGVISFLLIIFSMNDLNLNIILSYLAIFLFSSIISVIPISIGGVGVREASFIYISDYLKIDQEFGVAIGFSYFLINFIISSMGVFTSSIKCEKATFNVKSNIENLTTV